jgi:hypothetical protein
LSQAHRGGRRAGTSVLALSLRRIDARRIGMVKAGAGFDEAQRAIGIFALEGSRRIEKRPTRASERT